MYSVLIMALMHLYYYYTILTYVFYIKKIIYTKDKSILVKYFISDMFFISVIFEKI